MAAHPSPERLPAPILVQPVLPRQHIVGIQWEEGWVYGTEGLGERQPGSEKQLHSCPSACREPMAPQQHRYLPWDRQESPDTRKHGRTSKAGVGQGLPGQVPSVPVQPLWQISPSQGHCSSAAPQHPPLPD